jgi:ATP-binding cassette, subfamily C, bacterial CydD
MRPVGARSGRAIHFAGDDLAGGAAGAGDAGLSDPAFDRAALMAAGPVDQRLVRQAPAAVAGVAAAVALGLLGTGLLVAQAVLLARVLARAFGLTPVADLRGTLGWLAAVLLARALVAYAGEAVAGRAAVAVQRQLRGRLVRHALALGPSWLARSGTGELTTLATRGLDGLDGYVARFLPQLVLAALVPVVVLVVLVDADVTAAVIVLVTLPLIPLFLVLAGLLAQARTERQWDLLQRLGGHFLDVVEGLPTLTVFRRARAQVDEIRRATDEHRRATMSTLRLAFLSGLVLELLATLATALVAVAVGLRLLRDGIPYETALLVLLLAPEAFGPIRRVGTEYHAGREGAVAAGRVLDLLDLPAPAGADGPPGGGVAGGPGTSMSEFLETDRFSVSAQRPREAAELVLDALSVTHPERGAATLDGASLVLAAGARVALVGASGAGKSTLFSVLLRFTPVDAGTVRWGGRDALAGPAADWRNLVAWLPQQPHLLAGTVADNVRLGRPGASRAELDAVAAATGLDAVLARLPAGWDTPVGERGLRLSTGQRQRVALARVLLRDAPLVLLDEPTAHLDADSAAAVRRAVLDHAVGRTLLVTAHDPAWSTALDRTVRLAHGRLADAPSVVAT